MGAPLRAIIIIIIQEALLFRSIVQYPSSAFFRKMAVLKN